MVRLNKNIYNYIYALTAFFKKKEEKKEEMFAKQ